MFRKHQDQFGQICAAIRSGEKRHIKRIVCATTPGGGKSLLPLIAANELIPAIAERLCWVVPRRALQLQAEQEFVQARGRQLLGHQHVIRRAVNELDPARGLSGFATTYQAIGLGNAHLVEEFKRYRYILVLDEPHHVEEGGLWSTTLEPLVNRAALTVFMSGTLERGNRKRIAFLPYLATKDGEVVDLYGDPQTAGINYSRRDALVEKAILPIHFELMDGTSEWIGTDGETYSIRLSEANKNTAEAVYTALKTQFAEQLLDECSAHWVSYKKSHPRSKLLVVTANIEDAQKYVDYLLSQGISAAIATSEDSSKAAANIERYKECGTAKAMDALVTVAMAYEGLDVPPITHIACLTHIRSKPWIEQMLARATRFDAAAGPWESQMAYVYVPDDRNMVGIIQAMENDQRVAVRGMVFDADETPPNIGEASERSTITPVGSQAEQSRWSQMGNLFAWAGEEWAMGEEKPFSPAASAQLTLPSTAQPHLPNLTPSQMEADLRRKIDDYCKDLDRYQFGGKWGAANAAITRQFSTPRSQMALSQLSKVVQWLEETYNLGRPVAPPPRRAASPKPAQQSHVLVFPTRSKAD